MDVNFFIRGLIIGFMIAAPVGPIGVLCIQRTLTKGKLCGLISGLGAATADTIYGTIAALGMTFISTFLLEHQVALRLVGALFLCGLGVRTILLKAAKKPAPITGMGLAANYITIFFLTLMNPMTVLAFVAIFAGLGITGSDNGFAGGILIVGVFIGSCIWWILLCSIAGLFRKRINQDNLVWLNRISGILIIAFGVLLLFNLKT
ncbi:MAG: LysE family translocator [Planctomycetota bacterium]|jgi:threonine/homoserine/homoserine lactone efflux protein